MKFYVGVSFSDGQCLKETFSLLLPISRKMLIEFLSLSPYCRERQQEVEKGFVVFPGSSFCSLQDPSAYRDWGTFGRNICEYPMSLHFQSQWQKALARSRVFKHEPFLQVFRQMVCYCMEHLQGIYSYSQRCNYCRLRTGGLLLSF